MASWVLACVNCKWRFEHSRIEEDGFRLLRLAAKPEFPIGGSEIQCPNCGHKAIYQRHARPCCSLFM